MTSCLFPLSLFKDIVDWFLIQVCENGEVFFWFSVLARHIALRQVFCSLSPYIGYNETTGQAYHPLLYYYPILCTVVNTKQIK